MSSVGIQLTFLYLRFCRLRNAFREADPREFLGGAGLLLFLTLNWFVLRRSFEALDSLPPGQADYLSFVFAQLLFGAFFLLWILSPLIASPRLSPSLNPDILFMYPLSGRQRVLLHLIHGILGLGTGILLVSSVYLARPAPGGTGTASTLRAMLCVALFLIGTVALTQALDLRLCRRCSILRKPKAPAAVIGLIIVGSVIAFVPHKMDWVSVVPGRVENYDFLRILSLMPSAILVSLLSGHESWVTSASWPAGELMLGLFAFGGLAGLVAADRSLLIKAVDNSGVHPHGIALRLVTRAAAPSRSRRTALAALVWKEMVLLGRTTMFRVHIVLLGVVVISAGLAILRMGVQTYPDRVLVWLLLLLAAGTPPLFIQLFVGSRNEGAGMATNYMLPVSGVEILLGRNLVGAAFGLIAFSVCLAVLVLRPGAGFINSFGEISAAFLLCVYMMALAGTLGNFFTVFLHPRIGWANHGRRDPKDLNFLCYFAGASSVLALPFLLEYLMALGKISAGGLFLWAALLCALAVTAFAKSLSWFGRRFQARSMNIISDVLSEG